jgi:hypothetical protein
MHGKPYIKTEWLHKKRKRRSKVDEYGERYVKLDRVRSLGEYWLCSVCMQEGKPDGVDQTRRPAKGAVSATYAR